VNVKLHATLYIKIYVSQTSPSVSGKVVILTYISDAICRHPVWPALQSYNQGLPNRLEPFVLSFDCIGALVLVAGFCNQKRRNPVVYLYSFSSWFKFQVSTVVFKCCLDVTSIQRL
jgi:hypothetical protein